MSDVDWKQLIDRIGFDGLVRQAALNLELLNKIHNNWFFEMDKDNKLLVQNNDRMFRFLKKMDLHFRYWQIVHIFVEDNQNEGLYSHTTYQDSIVRNRIKQIRKPFVFSELELKTLAIK